MYKFDLTLNLVYNSHSSVNISLTFIFISPNLRKLETYYQVPSVDQTDEEASGDIEENSPSSSSRSSPAFLIRHPTSSSPSPLTKLPSNIHSGKLTKGKQKIPISFMHDRIRRSSTFSKRKTGLMKKASELAALTGAEVLLLIASETNHVYTYATDRLKAITESDQGKELIHSCLGSNLSNNHQQPPVSSEETITHNSSPAPDDTHSNQDLEFTAQNSHVQQQPGVVLISPPDAGQVHSIPLPTPLLNDCSNQNSKCDIHWDNQSLQLVHNLSTPQLSHTPSTPRHSEVEHQQLNSIVSIHLVDGSLIQLPLQSPGKTSSNCTQLTDQPSCGTPICLSIQPNVSTKHLPHQ